ncbi:MAG: hypothetical protein ABRQ25_08845 [Clostridiaceae bacterium]
MLQVQNYGNFPLSFEINEGQTLPEVSFLTRGSGYSMFFTPSETVLLMRQSADKKLSPKMKVKAQPIETKLLPEEQIKPAVLRMKLSGANELPQVEGLEELPGKVNYFIGNDPSKWYTDISTFSRIKYYDVYPGIDIVYYGNQGQVEYDYVISPGADPGLITLDIQGVSSLDMDVNGDLILGTDKGQLYFKKPYIYQEANGI